MSHYLPAEPDRRSTEVNLVCLLVQIVVGADGCSVAIAASRVSAFLRREGRSVRILFLLVLLLDTATMGAFVLATVALRLATFYRSSALLHYRCNYFVWLLRGLVFHYCGLTAVGACQKLYGVFANRQVERGFRSILRCDRVPSQT